LSTLGPKSTAEDALRNHDLRGKTAVVTGAASGIGAETARVLARAGAEVVMAVRNVPAGQHVAARLRRDLGGQGGKLDVQALDLADLASVAAFVAAFRASGRPLHLLVENAGIMGLPRPGQTAQGFELQVGTNHLGHVALAAGLLPVLAASAPARLVVVASNAHRRADPARLLASLAGEPIDYSPMGVYGDSKLANILFASGLAPRLPAGVAVFSLHPGVIGTPLARKMGWRGLVFIGFASGVGRLFMKSVAQGAATTIYAATAPELTGHSGAYLRDCHLAMPRAPAVDPTLIDEVWRRSEAALARAGHPVTWDAPGR
jgi:NAD(P)-dependent dehydrogenase (short-subunit alcohol dehydrogenase family)